MRLGSLGIGAFALRPQHGWSTLVRFLGEIMWDSLKLERCGAPENGEAF